MPDILLVACNARYSHVAFALKTLRANLPVNLHSRSQILEFTIQNDTTEAAAAILELNPKIIALSVYLWSIDFMRTLTEIIAQTRPDIPIIIGGPEIASPESRQNDNLFKFANTILIGEGERAFAAVCLSLLGDKNNLANNYPEYITLVDKKIIYAPKPDIQTLKLPYDEYTDEDLKHRILYVETGRGCPYRCAFCLSSGDKPLRNFDLDRLFDAFTKLLQRGARSFKFLDRTLNASLDRALKILNFFLPYKDQIVLHFEMVPHEIPDALIHAMALYPPGAIQIEFGVQTLTPHVAKNISRILNADRLLFNLKRLRSETKVHIHADLIAGLPGESFNEFALGFERLKNSGVQEIQLGILKRLKGSPLDQQAENFQLVFSQNPPYEILQTPHMDFLQLTQFKRFARYYDVLVNNANFAESVHLICQNHFYNDFDKLALWIYQQTQSTQGISQTRWVKLLFEYMTQIIHINPNVAALSLIHDYLRSRKEDIPPLLKPFLPDDFKISACKRAAHHNAAHIRQEKHLDIE